MRIAVIGAGISGLVSAYVLAKAGVDVVLYEKEDSLGGHAKTVTVDDGVELDLGFMVFNRVINYSFLLLVIVFSFKFYRLVQYFADYSVVIVSAT